MTVAWLDSTEGPAQPGPGRQASLELHLGEREAIALAAELGASLLVDEREARRDAQRLGLHYFGSLRVLKEAKERDLIRVVRPALDDLLRAGTYLGQALYNGFLSDMGELE